MLPNQIIEELQKCTRALAVANNEYKTKRVLLAKANSEYKIALAKKLLILRNIEKCPASMVNDLAKGDELIAKLALTREMAEVDVDTIREGMCNIRIEIEALRSLLTWNRIELKNS